MFDKDSWQEIFDTIKKNKLRTFLTAFGVFWGIFMLVIMMGSGNGLRFGVLDDFSGTATNSFFVWAQKTSKPYKGHKPGRMFSFTNDDTKALSAELPELSTVAPTNQLGDYEGTNNVIRGLKSGGFAVMGHYPVIRNIEQIKLTSGRFLNEIDIAGKRKVAVIGKRVREVLFDREENPVGEYIRINGVYFRVVGTTSPAGNGHQSEEQSETIYVPFTAFQQAFNFGDRVGWYAITSRKDVPASVAEEKVIALLKERHAIAPEDMMAIGHWNMEEEYTKLSGLFGGIEMLVWFVGLGTLLAGVIGVSNIMLIVVKERTKEIGIKRALGATPAHIMRQLITEAIFLTSIAGYFGLIAGIGLLEAVSNAIPPDSDGQGMFKNPGVDLKVALIALAVLIISGAIAGLIPARKAVSIHPVEALRAE